MSGVGRYLVVYCHPIPDSFCAALRDAVTSGLDRSKAAYDLVDLYASGFDPAPSADERQAIAGPLVDLILDHRRMLDRAAHLVVVYPTWWSGPPSLLKGWVDLVLTGEGLPPNHPLAARQRRRDLHAISVVTTHGSGRWRNRLQGQVGRSIFLKVFARNCARRCRRSWIAMYDLDRADAVDRTAFVEQVERTFGGPGPGGD